MNANELRAAVEAVLFASGEPLEISRMAEVFECDIEQLENVLLNLSAYLDESGSGLCLLKLEDKYQLCSRSEYAAFARMILDLKKNTPLSPAAFEVLAVIAYNQPVTKSFIEQVRGVDCTSVIATLSQRGLIEEKGRLELPGRPLLYGTTPDFLRCFCVSSLDELPPLPEKKAQELAQSLEKPQIDESETKQLILPEEPEDGIFESEDTAFNEAFN